MATYSIIPALFLGACATGFVDIPFDSDFDGLMDDEEEALGTDPTLADSDGDDFDDMEEIEAGTDPLNIDDHPYSGGWPMDACADSISTEDQGYFPGKTLPQFELADQYGEMVDIYDFCDHAIYVIYGSDT